jgi:predicted nucleotidyltransferase
MHIDEPTLSHLLAKDPRIEAAYLLGSAARNEMHPGSDVDIAVIPINGTGIDDVERVLLGSELSFATGYTVDLGVISSSNLVYAREAVLTGRRIFVRDKTVADTAVASLLGMYAAFNEDRAEVLHAYSA